VIVQDGPIARAETRLSGPTCHASIDPRIAASHPPVTARLSHGLWAASRPAGLSALGVEVRAERFGSGSTDGSDASPAAGVDAAGFSRAANLAPSAGTWWALGSRSSRELTPPGKRQPIPRMAIGCVLRAAPSTARRRYPSSVSPSPVRREAHGAEANSVVGIVARVREDERSSALLQSRPVAGDYLVVVLSRGFYRSGRDVHSVRIPPRDRRAASSSRLVVPVFSIAR
jgi:hypothetical protein